VPTARKVAIVVAERAGVELHIVDAGEENPIMAALGLTIPRSPLLRADQVIE